MAKERPDVEKKEKKEKKHKHSEANGVTKTKSDKKEKKVKRDAQQVAAVNGADGDAAKENVRPGDDEDAAMSSSIAGVKDGEAAKALLVGASVPFANPMADEKTMKKVLKGVKRAAKHKALRRGVKEVVKSLRKSATNAASPPQAVVVLAADISPFDVISHIPVLCEDHHVPYIYVPSRAELGAAGSTKRPTSVVMVVPTAQQHKQRKPGAAEPDKAAAAAAKDDKEDWADVYADLAKVVERAGRDVRI